MATNAPQDDFHKTGLRLPRQLHAKLHSAAAGSGRSYNSEIVARLEASFSPGVSPSDAYQDVLDGEVRRATARAEALEMRIELLKSRLTSVQLRYRLISNEFEVLIGQPTSAANVESLNRVTGDRRAAEREMHEIRGELDSAQAYRAQLLAEVAKRNAKLLAFRTELEQRLASPPSPKEGSA